jgi:hypothetical protein
MDAPTRNGIDVPIWENEFMKKRFASPSWHLVADNRNLSGARLTWDGEVPFVR